MRRFWFATALILTLLLSVGAPNSITYGGEQDAIQGVEVTRSEIIELENKLKALDDSIQSRLKRLEELEKEHLESESYLQQAEEELAMAQIRLEVTSHNFAERVRSLYMKGGISYLEMLLQADSFGDLIIRVAYIVRILNSDAQLISDITEEQEAVFAWKSTIVEKRHNMQDLRDQQEAEHRNLAEEYRQQEAVLVAAKQRLAGQLALITPRAERKPVYGIVFDNAPQARPQHGLAKATVVYEYEVEGRITRYLGLFSSFPTKVGPIRSARFHNVILALENDVHFIYSSAGIDVLAKIREWEVRGTDALLARGFYRDYNRRAPHNLYVNLSTLGLEKQSEEVIIRPAFLSREGTPATEVSLRYSANYTIKYQYVKDKGAYRRYINNNQHRDGTGEEILARNIIIQYVPHGFDPRDRPYPDLIGEGAIDFYSQGQHFSGTWKKDSRTDKTRFYYQDGQEIERVFGQTWIQIARDS